MQLEFDLDFPTQFRDGERGKRAPSSRPRRMPTLQAGLPGLALKPRDNFFFALCPDAQAAVDIDRNLAQLAQTHRLKGKAIGSERYHLTLQNIGLFDGTPQETLAQASEAAGKVAFNAFDLWFDRAVSFTHKGGEGAKPFVLLPQEGSQQVQALARQLGEALAKAGLGKNVRKTLTPHVTMLYDASAVPLLSVPRLCLRIEAFFLIHSLQGRSRHERLARWQLRD